MSPESKQLAKKYSIKIEDKDRFKIYLKVIPDKVLPLVPYVEILGMEDQSSREEFLATVSYSFLVELRNVVENIDIDNTLTNWLGSEELWENIDYADTLYYISMIRDYAESFESYRR